MRIIQPTKLTWTAIGAIALAMAATMAYLSARYDALPDLLAVHFGRFHQANGWQFKTYTRVMMPVIIQAALAVVLSSGTTRFGIRPSNIPPANVGMKVQQG